MGVGWGGSSGSPVSVGKRSIVGAIVGVETIPSSGVMVSPSFGSWPGRFRKFVATFNMDNMDLINQVEVISLFARNAEYLEQLMAGLSEAQLAKNRSQKISRSGIM